MVARRDGLFDRMAAPSPQEPNSMMPAVRRRRVPLLAALLAASLGVMAVTAQTVVTPPKNK